MTVWVCIPYQSLTESLCLVMALNHWHLVDINIVLCNRCQASCRGLAIDTGLQVTDWEGSSSQTDLHRDNLPFSILQLVLHHKGCFSGWVWSDWIPWSSFPTAASKKYLSWASTLGFEKAPQFFMWQKASGRSQDVSKVIVPCCMRYKPAHRGSWSTNCLYVWGWQQPAQAYRAFTVWFVMPERALSSTENFLEPQTWWVSLIKVCCHWVSLLLLFYCAAITGKAESGPTYLCWYFLLLGICAVSLPAFFPLSKCMSLDI